MKAMPKHECSEDVVILEKNGHASKEGVDCVISAKSLYLCHKCQKHNFL